ncbi:hypothetical protein C7212DRAFT_364753 [Tuber magnatum]|uniref:Uncharacterized protein n=1 Tax=Tuber magnatum TaxID=42249 RepID=A0A317SKP2_9PEZI|nr:hypothetical protein C7212DRAFT_364753 [Tuber magnatum]
MDPGGQRNSYPQNRNRFGTGRPSYRGRRFRSNGSHAPSEVNGYEGSFGRTGSYSSNRRPHGAYGPDLGQASNPSPAGNYPLASRAHGYRGARDRDFVGRLYVCLRPCLNRVYALLIVYPSRRQGAYDQGGLSRTTEQPAPGHWGSNGIFDNGQSLSPRSWDRPEERECSQGFQDGNNRFPLYHQVGATGNFLSQYPVINTRFQNQYELSMEQFRDSRGYMLTNNPPISNPRIHNVDRRLEEATRWLEENIRPSDIVGQYRDTESSHPTSLGHHHASWTTEGSQRFAEGITSQSYATYGLNPASSLIPYLEMMAASRSGGLTIPTEDNHPEPFPNSNFQRGRKPQAELANETARGAELTRLVFSDDGYNR